MAEVGETRGVYDLDHNWGMHCERQSVIRAFQAMTWSLTRRNLVAIDPCKIEANDSLHQERNLKVESKCP
jgi:hypothetical protein